MTPRANQLAGLAAAIARVRPLDRPADALLHQFFREHPAMGRQDRAFVADGVFAYLRRRRSLEELAQTTRPGALALAVVVRELGIGLRELASALDAADAAWLRAFKSRLATPLAAAVAADLPDWLWARLGDAYGEAERDALARAWLSPAPLDLRVNPLKTQRDDARQALAASGIAAEPTPYSPLGLRVAGRPALARHPLFTAGAIEVQDESSQLVGYLVAPKRSDMVVDFCAGAGGKTLLLGALMRSQGRLYAFDTHDKRLANLKPRLARSGLSNVHPQLIAHERDPRVKRLAGKIDRVLVDAPCTGFGTLRRNPDLKWRQPESAVAELATKQRAILASAATLVKPGGRLVYATCSVLPDENEAIVDAFRGEHPEFAPLDAARGALARRHRARHRPHAEAPSASAWLRRLLRRRFLAPVMSDAPARAHAGRRLARAIASGLVASLAATAPALPAARAATFAAAGTVELAFTPGDAADTMIVQAIARAEHEVLVLAYTFTHPGIARALAAAHRRGVRVEVLADRAQTLELPQSAVPALAREGVPVWLDGNFGAAHNKVLIIDADGAASDHDHRELQLHARRAEEERRERRAVARQSRLSRAHFATISGACRRRHNAGREKARRPRRPQRSGAAARRHRRRRSRAPGSCGHGRVDEASTLRSAADTSHGRALISGRLCRCLPSSISSRIETALASVAGWVELAIVAACFGVGWLLERRVRLKSAAQDAGFVRVGLGGVNRLVLPLVTLGMLLVAGAAFRAGSRRSSFRSPFRSRSRWR